MCAARPAGPDQPRGRGQGERAPGTGRPRGTASRGSTGRSAPGRSSGHQGPAQHGPAHHGSAYHWAAGRRSRELSQNYLREPEAVRLFLRAVTLDPAGLCLEVGAGEGILTRSLAAACGEVIAYEVDTALAPRLRSRLTGQQNVRVVIGDFLASRPPQGPFQLIGNVPFAITSPIVDWCLAARRMTSATLITQLEYARKRTGGYGRWSLLTVSSWPFMSWELRGRIPRGQFRPMPRVDAGILHLDRRTEPLISPARLAAYRRLVQAGFAGHGGTLHASLARQFPSDRLAAAFEQAGIGRRTVVAFVTPGQWIQLFRGLDRPPAAGRG